MSCSYCFLHTKLWERNKTSVHFKTLFRASKSNNTLIDKTQKKMALLCCEMLAQIINRNYVKNLQWLSLY